MYSWRVYSNPGDEFNETLLVEGEATTLLACLADAMSWLADHEPRGAYRLSVVRC